MEQRAQFIALWQEGLYSMTQLCQRFAVSRKTGYKWLERYERQGLLGLADQSRAPKTVPHQMTAQVQQLRFDAFRQEFNQDRPHEARQYKTPASVYLPSPRSLPTTVPGPEYAGHFFVRRISRAGTFRFQCRPLFLSDALIHEDVALEEVADGVWSIYFCGLLLARLDERDYKIRG